MDNTGLYTPLFESDVDQLVKDLAQINVTAALYIWLYSRAFALGNKIGISQVKLAGILGVHQRTIRSSVKRLKDKGLIRVKTNKSREGGSEFSLNRVPALKKWISEYASHKDKKGSRIKRVFSEPTRTDCAPNDHTLLVADERIVASPPSSQEDAIALGLDEPQPGINENVSDLSCYSTNRTSSPYALEDHSTLCDRVELPYNINNEYAP